MKNLYWSHCKLGFVKQHLELDSRGRLVSVEIPEEWRQSNYSFFLDKLNPKEYFLFVVTDSQLPEFNSLFIEEPRIKKDCRLVYQSKKFNNRTHNLPKDYLTLFIFQKNG